MVTSQTSPALLSPNTVYFETDSARVGDRYGIWVTTPPNYERKADERFPVLYVTDGNTNALLAAAANFLLLGDHLRPLQPFVQVCIGFADNDLSRRFVRRNRDFFPPGEPVSPRMERHVQGKAYAKLLGKEGHKEFMQHARNGSADRFLAFLEEELHPEISRRYRIDPERVGLYGHSQGGLFTLYALTSGSRLFNLFGAGSPGLMAENSEIYSRYMKLVAATGAEGRAIRLHMIANDLEMTGSIDLYRDIGRGFLRFIDAIKSNPLPGLQLITTLTQGENHFSGVFDAYRSFLRASYATRKAEHPTQHPGI